MIIEPSPALPQSPEEYNLWSSWWDETHAKQIRRQKHLHLVPTCHPQQVSSDSISRSVQIPLIRPGFDAVLCVSKHIPLTTVSHCHDWRNWKLRLLQLYLTHKQAWKGNPKKLCVSINKWCHSNNICSLFTLLVSIACSNINQLHVAYFQSPCSARTCTTLWVGWMFFL